MGPGRSCRKTLRRRDMGKFEKEMKVMPIAVERKAAPLDEGQPAPHKRAGKKNHKGLYVLVAYSPWYHEANGYYDIESVPGRRTLERMYKGFGSRLGGEVIDGPAPYAELERAMVAFKSGKRAA